MIKNNRRLRVNRGGSRTAATSKMEHFVIIVNGWKPLTIITKSSILDVAIVLDPSLVKVSVRVRFILFYSKLAPSDPRDAICSRLYFNRKNMRRKSQMSNLLVNIIWLAKIMSYLILFEVYTITFLI